MTGERGFTLLEMVVATLIMAVAIVGLLSGISGATRNAARLRDYDRAVQLARLRMNELMIDYAMPRDTLVSGTFDRALTGGIESGWPISRCRPRPRLASLRWTASSWKSGGLPAMSTAPLRWMDIARAS